MLDTLGAGGWELGAGRWRLEAGGLGPSAGTAIGVDVTLIIRRGSIRSAPATEIILPSSDSHPIFCDSSTMVVVIVPLDMHGQWQKEESVLLLLS